MRPGVLTQTVRGRSAASPPSALCRLLDELDSLLRDLDSELYCARFAADVSGSIGEHVRHCLDHVSALVAADPSATLSYDVRQRGSAVENDPAEAVRQILQLKRALAAWSTRSLEEPIRVASMMSPGGDAVIGWSTLARELAFVVSHTIHHQAIIGLLLAVHGHAVPDRFGHSPSTPRRNLLDRGASPRRTPHPTPPRRVRAVGAPGSPSLAGTPQAPLCSGGRAVRGLPVKRLGG